MMSAILAHADRNASTVMVATHDPAIAQRMETVWHMRHGRLIDRTRRVAA
jgi:putative ABC transport system ATP-binding protein/lipoprotein-releasing system ATP-binding protein